MTTLGSGAGLGAGPGAVPGMRTDPSMAELVDWQVVVRLATTATPAGPRVTPANRRAVVALLRRSAMEAPAWVAEITGLRRAGQLAAEGTGVLVVDRAGMIATAAQTLREVLAQVPAPASVGTGWRRTPVRAAVSAQIAGVVGPLSTQLLGQVVPGYVVEAGRSPEAAGADRSAVDVSCGRAPDRSGVGRGGAVGGLGEAATAGAATAGAAVGPRMLLVAPNVLAFQQRMDLDRLDLPAWVTLHEATHAVQLAAAPWLEEHLRSRVSAAVAAVVGALRAGGDGVGVLRLMRLLDGREAGALGALLGEDGRRAFAELSAVLAVLEGHAEAVLDSVTPTRLPSAHRLRQVMAHRRVGGSVGPGTGFSGLINRVVRLSEKESQYVDGGEFVRAVLARVGHEGLNRVWSEPGMLPTRAEIGAPAAWLERVGLG